MDLLLLSVFTAHGMHRYRLSLYSQMEVIKARMLGNFIPEESRNVIQLDGTTRCAGHYISPQLKPLLMPQRLKQLLASFVTLVVLMGQIVARDVIMKYHHSVQVDVPNLGVRSPFGAGNTLLCMPVLVRMCVCMHAILCEHTSPGF